MGQDDWLLMHRVADGDEGAVAELYDRFGSLVYKVARQLLPSRAEAEDAVQEVFIRLWQTADRYDPRRAKLVTWVMLIAEDERNVSLMQRVAELPELQRVVIERAYLQGYTLREVSEQLEAPLGTVKSALSRGLARLRERAKADWAV
ncbi:MAG: sigma-70 family RNA polymerase sigma factor [Planctomycetota bacterium]|jgi:RNA polymerase sigma-70 factor (ECF subfamily)